MIYYLLKILSYSPIINITGEDKNFGDIEKDSKAIRLSLIGFTVIHYYCFFSFSWNKESKKFNFNIFHYIKFPLRKQTKQEIEEKVEKYRASIEECDPIILEKKLSVLKYKLNGQADRINHSLLKADIILGVFFGIFIFMLESRIFEISKYSGSERLTMFISILIFCFLTVSINLFFHLTRLTKVNSFTEVSIPKSTRMPDILKEEIVEYYTKYVSNNIVTTNQVSHNKWVQDYFVKFVIYSMLIFIIFLIPPQKNSVNLKKNIPVHMYKPVIFNFADSTTQLLNINQLYRSKEKLSQLGTSKLYFYSGKSKISDQRIASILAYYSLIINIDSLKQIKRINCEPFEINQLLLIIED